MLVPVEEIDLTFDKPFLFIIRDKETGEVWFAGTVYEPLSIEEEPEEYPVEGMYDFYINNIDTLVSGY